MYKKSHKPSSDAFPAYLDTKLVELCHALIEDIILHLLTYQDTIAVELVLKRLHLRKMENASVEKEPHNRLRYRLFRASLTPRGSRPPSTSEAPPLRGRECPP